MMKHKSFRIMGMWQDGRRFLIVMGPTRQECIRRFDGALAEYDSDDLDQILYLWLEVQKWSALERSEAWEPIEAIGLRRIKLQRQRGQRLNCGGRLAGREVTDADDDDEKPSRSPAGARVKLLDPGLTASRASA